MTAFDSDPDGLQQMYQEVILDAARSPHGRRHFAVDVAAEKPGGDTAADVTLAHAHAACVAGESHQFNPTCGDEATVRVEVSDGSDGRPRRIEHLIWDGRGCTISQASLSVMVDLVEGKAVDHALHMAELFHRLMESRGAGLKDGKVSDELGDAIVFQGVSRYPMRIKCALLGWEGMKASLARALAVEGKTGAEANAGEVKER